MNSALKDAIDAAQARWEADPLCIDKLVDCRLHENNRPTIKSDKHGHMARVYCANCGGESPYFVTENVTKVHYYCPKCEHLGRVPTDMVPVPGSPI